MSESSPPNLRQHGFQILEDDLRFLMNAFAAVLRQLGEPDLAAALPWIGSGAPAMTNRSLGQAWSIAFQLLNIVEERAASQVRRLREKKLGPAAEKGLWADNLKELQNLGLGHDEILAALKDVTVEPVLTAHPTEAKRETVRELHREIYSLMNRHENPAYTPREQDRLQRQLQTQLENLWRTGEIHVTRPSIEAELQNALHYLREVFPEALARAHVHLREAWEAAGFDPAEIDSLPPLLRFGSWIGGDRDGHPFVTAEVTRHALQAMRKNALRVQRRALESLGFHLPLSSLFQATPPQISQLVGRLSSQLQGETLVDASYIMERNKEEPWRAAAYLMRAKVVLAAENPTAVAAYHKPEELLEDLDALASALLEVGAKAVVEEQIVPLRRNIAAFGFHSAALDVRQNSAFHEKALDQLLRTAGVIAEGDSFIDWPVEKKRELLDLELASPRPFLSPGISAGPEADTVLACHRVLADHRKQFGNAGLGSLIVSMTRRVEDLLIVYLLAREAGLMEWTDAGLVCPLPVVPLFETMGDLEAGPGIVEAFMSHGVTQRSLAFQTQGGQPVFQVMVGYSDSNKDCGIVASQCALHRGQSELAATIQRHGARPIFFHGRGGTVGRGAGPTHWFMEALPHGSLCGGMRMTEQGETIAQKYAHISSAVYNAELLIASATAATARHRTTPFRGEAQLDPLFDKLATSSRDAYRALLHAPDFMKFYRQATPIDALENARIGSRPARRTGQASLDDLRAIPWVFSWTQSRFYLPGWFGAGSALNKLKTEDPQGFETLTAAIPTSPFLRYVLTNIESSLVSANKEFMRAYAGLVDDVGVRERFLNTILAEYDATRGIIDHIFQGTFEERRPRLAYTLNIREEPLKVLHQQQVALLKEWRGLLAAEKHEAADAMVTDLLISINAIASGLRTTG